MAVKMVARIYSNKRKTTEEYKKELSQKNPNIEPLEEYINMRTPILHLCKKHNVKWKVSPDGALLGHGCKQCGCEKIGNKKRKTKEDYIKELALSNPGVLLIGDYTNARTKTLHICVCGNKWITTPNNALAGKHCRKCMGIESSIRQRSNIVEYKQKLCLCNDKIVCIADEYITASTKIKHKCLFCNCILMITPNKALTGEGCRQCSYSVIGKKNSMTEEDFLCNIKSKNPVISIVSAYNGALNSITACCNICKHEWTVKRANQLYYTGCPYCASSFGEQRIQKYLEDHSIQYIKEYIFDDCKDIKNLRFDFYLPSYKRIIEFMGKQHEAPIDHWGGKEMFETLVKHDEFKREYAKSHNIDLLDIWYYNIEHIEEILKNYLNLESVETVTAA